MGEPASAPDYEAEVAVRCFGRDLARLPLHEAVRLVVEEWEPDQQQGASIAGPGAALPHLHAIRALYDRGDFPHMTG